MSTPTRIELLSGLGTATKRAGRSSGPSQRGANKSNRLDNSLAILRPQIRHSRQKEARKMRCTQFRTAPIALAVGLVVPLLSGCAAGSATGSVTVTHEVTITAIPSLPPGSSATGSVTASSSESPGISSSATATGTPGEGANTSPDVAPAAKTYNLTDVQSLGSGAGISLPKQSTIKTTTFPNSIRGTGYYSGDEDISYTLGGACTKLTVSVGQDAASPTIGGPSVFHILLDDVEKATATRGPFDEPQLLTVDVTGATRLKFTDERTSKDGYSIWGSPVLTCTRNPAPRN